MARKDFLDIASLSREEVDLLLDQATPFKELFTRSVKKVPALKGKSVLMLFYEPSTRTLSSFEVAAKRLSADVIDLDVPHSSVTKGETVKDTVDTLQAMRADYIVVRHKMSGLPRAIARQTRASVINAGDGAHAHPTQALLDAFTLKEALPDLSGRRILIAGDILHSRVARSTSRLFLKLGVEVGFLGPGSLVPRMGPEGITRFTDFDEALRWGPDAVYLLRVQMERQEVQYFPSVHEYHRVYGVTQERFERIRGEGIYIMHPGPVNRGVELCHEVMDYERSLINQQVENGIAARMAVLYWLKPQTDSEKVNRE
ncbi:MAG: aspartate carbamoyltransferase catalytic subunit [Roseibacillus sp.]|jgi:aspartate carbamoyltransferase catalytic subunit|nr:aspartate carbamoyltransferase [Roseibacillus sp.]MBP35900.1 aspartate carbamoyltransferase [Roseibacillus sp.]MCP4728863.1 aspartate carbamoyltransferase catalytic subunit [Roseibacillus sp.]MDP7307488.1 aspartate carbamoyltransferase catalytic subunit [Roseibacillus sp.]MDP7654502.1 aspartate carbamoyltransferase catalytic subunit [Roseibacillus sp.]|tara:strand:- start:3073 stop:4014 length:942 start_codon:yes stop_codon:yes gene_type:complete